MIRTNQRQQTELNQAEEEKTRLIASLQESEERYRSAIAALQEGVVVHKADGTIDACNPSAERILGLSSEQINGCTCLDPRWRTIHEDGSPFPGEVHPAMVSLRTGQPISDAIMGVYKPNGTLTWISINSQPLFRAGETLPYAVVASFSDITQRKQAELELHQLKERLQFLLSSSPAVIFTCKPSGNYDITYISDNIVTVVGYESVEFLNNRHLWRRSIHPEDAPRIAAGLSQLFEQGHHGYEYRLLHKDGTYRWIRSELKLLRDETGRPLEIVGYAADISGRKRTEIALRQQFEQERLIGAIAQRVRKSLQLEEILNTTVAELQQVLQADRVLVYQIFSNGTGGAIAEAVATGCSPILNTIFAQEVFPPENYERYLQGRVCAVSDRNQGGINSCLVDFLEQIHVRAKLVVPIIQTDKLWGLLIAHQCQEPRQWQEWEISLFQQLANQLAIAIQQSLLYQQLKAELSERKQAEENLKDSLKEKEILFKEIHHRVKNNLYVVSSLLELQSDTIADPQSAKMFEESQNRIYSMALIHEKLYRSHNIAKVNFGEYLQDLVDRLFYTYNVSKERIEVKIETDSIFLNIETAAPCGLIVNELVSNTMKHAFPNDREGIVSVKCCQDWNKQIHLMIKDNGIGFPDTLDFRTIDSMGFQVVCTLVEQLEGSIELDRNNGTAFHLKFFELQYSKRV
jgi:PAS domain S-box-containing protein